MTLVGKMSSGTTRRSGSGLGSGDPLSKAEEYIRGVRITPHSWWQVHPHVVHATDLAEGDEVYHYSHRGTRLRTAPIPRAIAAFRKHAAKYPAVYPTRPPEPA